MASLKFTKNMYKVQANKRMKEESGVGYALRHLVQMEQMLVMNDTQFRWFYEKFSGHQLLGGEEEDLNCLKLSILRELLNDMCVNIDERGVFHYEEFDRQTEQNRMVESNIS